MAHEARHGPSDQPLKTVTGRPLSNREAVIRKRAKIPVDSVVYQSELREDR